MIRWLVLYPVSQLYRLIMATRNFLYDINYFNVTEFSFPVICVGNITVGGTGKTPHIELLVNLLKPLFKIAVVSRGYKRKTKGYLLADAESTVEQIGDEPRQIKRKFEDIQVAVCEKRVTAVNNLLGLDNKPEVILLDDAYQHRSIKPGYSILLIDSNRITVDDYLMPFGRLRESPHQSSRANMIIITKCPHNLKPIDRRVMAKHLHLKPFQTIFFTGINYKTIIPLFTPAPGNVSITKKTEILLVTGIAKSDNLVMYIKKNISEHITHIPYPDHHNFSKRNMLRIAEVFAQLPGDDKIVLTTEKDAVRLADSTFLPETVKPYLFYVPIEINFIFNDENDFYNQILNYVRKDTTNYKLHTTIRQF